jgi:pimeloyl-[acyl-carrier protein] methyl ester esterase
MPRLDADLGGLHAQDPGAGDPVVLVHGWSLSSAVFAEEARLLARTRRVIAPDLRGHGGSAPGPFTLADLAEDLGRLFSAHRLERAVLAGWSLGALAALAALPLVRGRLAGLVLVSGSPRFVAGDGWPWGAPALAVEAVARRVRRDPGAAAAWFFDSMFVEGELDPAGLARLRALRQAIPVPGREAALAGLAALVGGDLRPSLAGIDLPVLLVHGERDPICPAAASCATAAALPRARLAEIPGAGHAPFLSRPAAFRAALGAFLAEVAA